MDIASYLEANNFTAADLGRAIGVTAQAAHRYVRRERKPKPEIGERIVRWSNGEISFEGIYGPAPPAPAETGAAA